MQWLVLRSRLDSAWRWIPTNMGAWAVGNPVDSCNCKKLLTVASWMI
jgi:hypothetical protein